MSTKLPVVVLDPGHGGDAPVGGSSPNHAVGPNGLLEKDVALDLVLYAKMHLHEPKSAEVLVTRSTTNESLTNRARKACDREANVFLSIHLNGWTDPQVDGTTAYVARQASASSRRLAARLIERLAAAAGVPNRGVQERDLGVLLPARHAPQTSACLLEVAYLTNPQQAQRLVDGNYQEKLGAAIAEVVREHLACPAANGKHPSGGTATPAAAFGNGYAAAFSEEIPLDPGVGGQSIGQDSLQMGDIIVSTTSAAVSRIIRLGTGSAVSHAMVYLGGGEVMEAVGAGVTRRSLDQAIADSTVAVAFRHPNITPSHALVIRDYVGQHEGKPYNYVGIVRQARFQIDRQKCRLLPESLRERCINFVGRINFGTADNETFFCSELVLAAYKHAGLPLTTHEPHWGSPGDIADLRLTDQLSYVGHLKAPPVSSQGLSFRRNGAPAHALVLPPASPPPAPPGLNAWADLISFRPPAAIQTSLKNRRGPVDWPTHRIEDAHGPINLDYYPVTVSRLPTVGGRTLTAEEVLNHVRLNLNSFIDVRVAEFFPYDAAEARKWTAASPLGAIVHIDMKAFGSAIINPDDGSVVVADYTPEYWIFSTIWTTEDFGHPVSGNRQFGFVLGEDGSTVFYTRGADRATARLDQVLSDGVFNSGHALWLSLQRGLVAFVSANGGSAVAGTPVSERFEWEAVKSWYHHPTTAWI